MIRIALLLAALTLSGCLGTTIDGIGVFMCPPETHCLMEMTPMPTGAPVILGLDQIAG